MAQHVAEGSLLLTLDASQLNAGLKKTAANAKVAGKEMSEGFKKSAGPLGSGALGGGLEAITALGSKAGLFGAIAAAIAVIGKGLIDANGPAQRLRKETELHAESVDRLKEKFSEFIGDQKELASAMSDIGGTQGGLQFLKDQYEALEKISKAKRKDADATELQMQAVDSMWKSQGFTYWIAPGASREEKESRFKKTFEALKNESEEARKAFLETKKAYERLMNPESNPQAVASLRQFVADMKEGQLQAEGMTAEMSQLNKLQRQFGLSAKQMAEGARAIGLKKMAEDAKALKDANKEATEYVDHLALELNNLATATQRLAEEDKLDEFVKKGIDEQQIERLRMLIQLKKQASQTYTPLNAIARGSAQEISFQNQNTFEQQRNADLKKQLEAINRMTTGVNKVAMSIEEMNRRDAAREAL